MSIVPACVGLLLCASACSGLRLDSVSDPVTPKTQPAAVDSLETARKLQEDFSVIARRAAPSVVSVRAYVKTGTGHKSEVQATAAGWGGEQPNQAYPGYELANACSGFVIDASGEVLTCAHALERADGTVVDLVEIETSDGARILADVIGSEPTVDLAILRCAVFPAGHAGTLPALQFGDSDALECGQWTFGMGDPAGPEKFFSPGTFIARPVRECYQDYLSAFYLQTAMVVPPQAYGGPLLDVDGEVIGILAPRSFTPGSHGDEARSGVEMALPSKIVKGLYESIRKAHSFQSPWLGFSVMSRAEIAVARGVDVFNAMKKPRNGILVENVFTPSPASAAGIRPNDFLVGFDAYKVFSPVDFQRYLYLAGIGKTVKLELFRDGETLHVELAIERRPAEARPR